MTADYGQVYVNACHFESNSGADLSLNWSHSHSIRNCTSHGSNMFLWGQDLTIENCAIDAWKSNSSESPLALNSNRGPFLVFDCSLTNPPNAQPSIKLDGSGLQCAYSSILRQGAPETIAPGTGNSATEIPRGKRLGSSLDPLQSFLQQTISVPSRIYDVKAFGAKGDGATNDADAIQRDSDCGHISDRCCCSSAHGHRETAAGSRHFPDRKSCRMADCLPALLRADNYPRFPRVSYRTAAHFAYNQSPPIPMPHRPATS